MGKRGLTFVFLTAIISGFSIFINKFGVQGINPFIFTGLKNIIVSIFLFSTILLLKEFKNLKSLTKRDWFKLALVGLLGGSIPFLLFFKGLQLTSAAFASFIHKTMFIYVAILALIFLKEKVNKTVILAAILLLIGNALLLQIKPSTLNLGDFLILIATLVWALEITLSKYLLKNLTSRIVAFGRMFFGSLFILIFLMLTKNISLIQAINLEHISWVLITSLLLYLYVFTFYAGLKLIPATVATSILLAGSIITTLLTFIFVDQSITLLQTIGIILLISGITYTIYVFRTPTYNFSTAHFQ